MILITDHAVVVVGLPDAGFPNAPGGDALPSFNQLCCRHLGSEKEVNVIGHDDPGVVQCSFRVCRHQNIAQDCPIIWNPQ